MIILDLVWFHIGALVAVFMPTVCLRALRHWRRRGECMLQMGRSAIQTRLSNGTADRGIWEKAARSTEQPPTFFQTGFRSITWPHLLFKCVGLLLVIWNQPHIYYQGIEEKVHYQCNIIGNDTYVKMSCGPPTIINIWHSHWITRICENDSIHFDWCK